LRIFSTAVLLALALTGCKGPEGVQGEPGPPGPGANPNISLLSPSTVYLGRILQVTVSGSGTQFADDTEVDFGEGVEVLNTHAASEAALVVTIEVTTDAPTGTRDVVVGSGDDALVYDMAFNISPAVRLSETLGSVAQGSILFGEVELLDVSQPLDTTTTGDGLFTPLIFTNLAISGAEEPDKVYGTVDAAQPFGLSYTMFLDIDAAAGPTDVEIASGPDLGGISVALGALDVTARTAELLSAGTTSITAPDAYGSALYRIEPTAGQLVSLSIDSTGGLPSFILVPGSGHMDDFIDFTASTTFTATGPLYLVYWDNSGEGGYSADLNLSIINPTTTVESEPNDTCGGGAAVDLPLLATASLFDIDDVDWVAVNVTADDIGKRLHMVTLPGDDFTDTVVQAYGSDCETALGDASSDSGYHEDHFSDTITAEGVHWIRVWNSTWGYAEPNYELLVLIE